MKYFLFTALVLFSLPAFSAQMDTLKLESEIKHVTVFLNGAQVTREAKVTLEGKRVFVLENLPVGIEPQSIQVDNDDKGEILNVKHEVVQPKSKPKGLEEFEKRMQAQKVAYRDLKNRWDIFALEEKILLDNSNFSSKEAGTTISEISEASEFYRSKLNEIRRNQLRLQLSMDSVKEVISELQLETSKALAREQKPHSRIFFVVDSDVKTEATFKISYYMPSAGWTASYDFRVNDIREPLTLVYNAGIFQSTGEDWKNVGLTLSTGRPSLSNLKPELERWVIERGQPTNVPHTDHEGGSSTLMGTIIDAETGEALPFVNILILKDGSMIMGASSDFDGKYMVKPIPSGVYDVRFNYMGYHPVDYKYVRMTPDRITFLDTELHSSIQLSEVVVAEEVEYSVPLIHRDGGSSGGVVRQDISRMPSRSKAQAKNVRGTESQDFESVGYRSERNITSLEYEIETPYSIHSDGKDNLVKIKEVKMPVNYIYKTVPKLDTDVFLTAEIADWWKLNLISGQSNLYYNGVFTGKSEIDVNELKDTLSVSLHRDQNIVVDRTSQREKNEKQFLGNNVRETVHWTIALRNNNDFPVTVWVEDQFPVSENNAITIERLESSGGKVDDKTGKILWEVELEPNQKRELKLSYSVRYPANMHLPVE